MKKSMVIDKNNIIEYEEFGSGKLIILLPSLFLSSYSYRPIAQQLGKFFNVIIPNFQRGKTKYEKNAYGFSDYAFELHRFIRERNIKQFSLVGFSFSTLIALEYSILYPHHVQKLFLFSGTLFPEKIKHKWWRFVWGYVNLLCQNLLSIKGNAINIRWFRDGFNFLSHHPWQFVLDIKMATSSCSFEEITNIIPIILINASRDKFLPQDHVPYIQNKNIEYRLIKNYHGWFFNEEEELVKIIQEKLG